MTNEERLVEEKLNRLLRRADWRFLLPNPWPAKTAVAVEGLLRQAVSLLGGEVSDLQPGLPGHCDLVVLQNPDRKQLRAAWEALEAGGALYVEWKLPALGGPAAIRRALERAGFTEVATYWAWPMPERAPSIFWLPIEASSALKYFLERRPSSPGLLASLIRASLRVAWDIVRRLRLIAPLSTIAVKPGNGEPVSPHSLPSLIQGHWQLDGRQNPPAHFDYLLLTGGLRSINKTVLLVFEKGEPRPGLVVKLPRVPESIPFLEKEARNLEKVHSNWDGHLPGVPQVHFYRACPPFAALGEDALEGEPIQTRLSRENFSSLAKLATDWQVQFAHGGSEQEHFDWWTRLGAPALAEFKSKYGPVLSPAEVERAARLLVSLGALPRVCEQRDFSPWNVLLGPQGQLVVLDWESAELQGLPCLDLVYFLTFLSFFVDGAMDSKRYLDSFRSQLEPDSFSGRVVQECQERYLKAVNLDLAVLPALRLFAWMIHSLAEHQRLVEDNGGSPSPKDLQGSLFLQLWREELSRIPASINRV